MFNLAIEHRDAGRFATALVVIEHYRKLNSGDNSTDLVYSQLLTHIGRIEDARTILNNTKCAKHHGSFRYLTAWVTLYRESGDKKNEELCARKMILEIPDESHGYVYLGCCLAKQGKLEAAESAFRDGSVRTGCPEESMLNLAKVLRSQLRLKEANEVLEKAKEIAPDDERIVETMEDLQFALNFVAEQNGAT